MNKIIYLHNDPDIYYIDNFLDISECMYIINKAKPNFKRALVSDDNKISNSRTGLSAWLSFCDDKILFNIATKISNLVGLSLDNAEKFQVIYYDKHQEYKHHYDAYDITNIKNQKKYLSNGGQRLLTTLCYLNNVEKGGETNFSKININVQPKKGRIIVFENTYKNTNIKHNNSLHAGMPVLSGEKYAFNLWFREKKVNK